MDLDPQVAPSISIDVFGGSRQRSKEEVEGATDDEDPNIGDDFDDM
jgi:hypothetical protein